MPEQTPTVGMERKLAAIFSTDVAGYSRLMGDDEAATIRTLTSYREVMTTLIHQHRGRVVDAPGDNLLAEFASVVDAVQAAVEIQRELKVQNADLPDARKMEYRIGINVGDVVVEGERLYGDGVNIAARLESLAIPGGICISGTVYDQVENKLSFSYEYVGEQAVKNIAKPVRVYRVVLDTTAASETTVGAARRGRPSAPLPGQPQGVAPTPTPTQVRRMRPTYRMVIAGLVLLAVVGAAARYWSSLIPSTQPLAPSTQAALPLPDKPSLIVLPFVNMSEDPKQEYFSDGLTEVLTGDLSKISSLFIIARNSAFTYKGKAVKVQDVGREMGVRYVLEGSVQKADQRVRITAQLIETATGYHLWSEQYDRPLTDIFALQDEIVQKIVTTLKLQLTLQEQGWIVRKHTDNLEAYDAYLRGREALESRFTKEANVQARQMYEKAIALDPQYAEVYARLGLTYWLEWSWRWSADLQTLEQAFALEQKALTLDDSLPVAHASLSWVYAEKKQYAQAIAEGERAIALDPNNADSYTWQAAALNYAGRPEEALGAVKQAMRLNPRYPPFYLFVLGWAYRMTGQSAEAVASLQEAISRSPNFPAHANLADSYWLQWTSQQNPDAQTLEQALAAAQQAVTLIDVSPWGHMLLGIVYLWQKLYEPAIAEAERAVALAPNEAETYAALAEVLSRAGKPEEALEAAAQALRLKPLLADYHLANVGAAYAVAGRYDEARAPLQRYLSRYPNILPAHLTLAVVYSELGQAAEARAEAAEVLRLNPNFSLEVHKQRMPIKDPAVLERHIAALRKAGLK